jgi:MurNAc alpha-1-phosphate uridylyltransferase
MRAMILAAGRGERMRPLTDHTPKPLLCVGGKPLIVWHLERLAQAGFSDVVINHAYLGSQIESALGNGSHWGLNIAYGAEPVALETAGGIANALHLLGDSDFLVVNADTYTDVDFAAIKHSLQPPNLAHLLMVNNPAQHPAGDFFYADGQLLASGALKLTFSGVGIYQPSLFAHIERGQAAKLAPILRAAIAQQLVTASHYQGQWQDIGTPQRLHDLDQQLTAPPF